MISFMISVVPPKPSWQKVPPKKSIEPECTGYDRPRRRDSATTMRQAGISDTLTFEPAEQAEGPD
jgi:hypothetical protein